MTMIRTLFVLRSRAGLLLGCALLGLGVESVRTAANPVTYRAVALVAVDRPVAPSIDDRWDDGEDDSRSARPSRAPQTGP